MRKRLFDIAVVSLAAIAWVPVVLVAAAAVLLLSGRPIFYHSRRWVGPGTAIRMLKLRVMVPQADRVATSADPARFLSTPPDSPLYTPIGRVLDRLGLNEIPQFVHVLKGEMSIIGARPLTDAVRDCLIERHTYIDDRWLTPAGLTGLPQLVGRMDLSDSQRLHLEAAYSRAVVERYSFRRDFQILLYTVLITFGVMKPLSFERAYSIATNRTPRTVHMSDLAPAAYTMGAEADVA